MRRSDPLSRQAGVTLLELLVVLVILATVTAAVAVPLTRQSQSQASQVADVRSLIARAQWSASKTGTATLIVSADTAAARAEQSLFELPADIAFVPRGDARAAITLFPDGSAIAPALQIGSEEFQVDVLTGALNAQ